MHDSCPESGDPDIASRRERAADPESAADHAPAATPTADGGTTVDPTDREAVRRNLERFVGTDAVTERDDGTLVAEFGGVTHVTVYPDGRIDAGMPLHDFSGRADRLVFDHEAGDLHVRDDDALDYTFRHP